MFSVVYNNIQKITNISIKKPIILISILNKYLDISIYLDNRTPLLTSLKSHKHFIYYFFTENQGVFRDFIIQNSVRITEGSDNGDLDNRGPTVYIYIYIYH